ncbi:MAG: RNA-binding domain-containing protein [Promethearchaeota archaeon]
MKEIKEIEIEAFVQATEDLEKVFLAIRNLIPPELQENNFILNKVRGVFHNPIIIVRTKYSQNTRQIAEYIAQNFGESNKNYLFQSLIRRIDKGNLYLRFEKQALYQKKMKIKDVKDAVKVRFRFSNKFSKKEKMIELLREMKLIL